MVEVDLEGLRNIRERLDRAAPAALLLALLPVVATGEGPLTPNQIREVLVGNTIHGIGEESGEFFAIYYRTDGIASGKAGVTEAAEQFWYQEGAWEITSEEGYCLTWPTWKHGERRCMDMVPNGTGYEFRTKDGILQSFVKVLPGNPNGL